jgi:hypothetical protein
MLRGVLDGAVDGPLSCQNCSETLRIPNVHLVMVPLSTSVSTKLLISKPKIACYIPALVISRRKWRLLHPRCTHFRFKYSTFFVTASALHLYSPRRHNCCTERGSCKGGGCSDFLAVQTTHGHRDRKVGKPNDDRRVAAHEITIIDVAWVADC